MIDEKKLKELIRQESFTEGHKHVIRVDSLLSIIEACRVKILSPAEIKAGIKWFKKQAWLPKYHKVSNTFITDLLRVILKKPQRTWNPDIFKLEEKKDEQG